MHLTKVSIILQNHSFRAYRGYSKVRTPTDRRKVLIDLPWGPRTGCVLNSEQPLYSDPDHPPNGKLAERCVRYSVQEKGRIRIRAFFQQKEANRTVGPEVILGAAQDDVE